MEMPLFPFCNFPQPSMLKYKTKWYLIAHSVEELEEQIPLHGILVRTIAGTTICLVRNAEGFFAVKDKCPHQGVPLHTGKCTEDGKIICAWHRYAFDLKTGRGAGLHVDTYPIRIEEKGVYLGKEYFSWLGE